MHVLRQVTIDVEYGHGFTFTIMEEVNEFWISYHQDLVNTTSAQREQPSPALIEGLTQKIRQIMQELDVTIPHVGLDFLPIQGNNGSNSFSMMDRRRKIAFIRLPYHAEQLHPPRVAEVIDQDYILYHEFMHLKDCLEHRFPTGGTFDPVAQPDLTVITIFWHFSIEGRLERLNVPHKPPQSVLKDAWTLLQPLQLQMDEACLQRLCQEYWGHIITFQQCQTHAHRLVHKAS